jgi:hypothetical protein
MTYDAGNTDLGYTQQYSGLNRLTGNTDLGYTQQYSGLNRLTGNTIHKYKRSKCTTILSKS